jgi:Mn-dependent DtxR family transcriptional regulator
MHTIQLPEDYALVLQQVEEDGEEDFANLAESLKFDRKRLSHILHALQNKGLIQMSLDGQRDAWIRISSKGHQLINYLWPESGLHPSY